VTTARGAGCQDIVLLHCISSYPAPIEQSNLRQISEIARRFNVIPGLSDHTLGTTVSVASIALGACVIEKHFTLSRQDKGPDSEFSLEPSEFRRLCTETKEAWLALGSAGFERQVAEEGCKAFRRSLYFVRDLPVGHILGTDDLRRIRPGHGLPPKYLDDVLGKTLQKDVFRGDPVRLDDFIN
jgi:N-acetylneuraminate synthase